MKENTTQISVSGIRKIQEILEIIEISADLESNLNNDPVGLVWELPESERELGGLIASGLAYGRVDVLRKAIEDVFERLEWRPLALASAEPDEIAKRLQGFVYRMTKGDDLADLIVGASRVIAETGSLEDAYLEGEELTHLERASAFVNRIRSARIRENLGRGFAYLMPDPALGSTTKRLHLYLRWMVRPAPPVDFGLWTRVSPASLIIPVDTHIAQFARHLGLTNRKSNDLKTALEITESLSKMDPVDPLRFDFPLCHLAISSKCIHRFDPPRCEVCPAKSVCSVYSTI